MHKVEIFTLAFDVLGALFTIGSYESIGAQTYRDSLEQRIRIHVDLSCKALVVLGVLSKHLAAEFKIGGFKRTHLV